MTVSSDQATALLLAALSDGAFHSGEHLGELLGVSRTAVWKQLQKLEGLGLSVASVKGRGYQLQRPIDLLDLSSIQGLMAKGLPSRLTLHSFLQTDSTNMRAMAAASSPAHGHVFLAEQQTAGRGRRGKAWASPFGANIYLSVVWSFQGGAAALSGLSLAVGVACARMLQSVGLAKVRLKWPNDLLVDGKKLGGILLEMTGDPAGDCQVVIGIGINVGMPDEAGGVIDQPWVDLRGLGVSLGRNELVAKLLSELVLVLDDFSQLGFAAFKQEWCGLDAFAGKSVTVSSAAQAISGINVGVDATGALVLDVAGELTQFHGGELSLRPQVGP